MNGDVFELYLQYQREVALSKLKVVKTFQDRLASKTQKRTPKVDVVENVLRIAGRPLHVSEIIEYARSDFDVELDRDSVVSMVVKKIRAGQTFIRTAPNTFALKPIEGDVGGGIAPGEGKPG
jgi:hypothetical protein